MTSKLQYLGVRCRLKRFRFLRKFENRGILFRDFGIFASAEKRPNLDFSVFTVTFRRWIHPLAIAKCDTEIAPEQKNNERNFDIFI